MQPVTVMPQTSHSHPVGSCRRARHRAHACTHTQADVAPHKHQHAQCSISYLRSSLEALNLQLIAWPGLPQDVQRVPRSLCIAGHRAILLCSETVAYFQRSACLFSHFSLSFSRVRVCFAVIGCQKHISQCFCFDHRCATPCDDEVPFMIGEFAWSNAPFLCSNI
jgi:hypothetical protein